MKAMMIAVPDWSFNARILNEQGETVLFVTQITGTHTGDLSLPELPIIPPTGRKIALPCSAREDLHLIVALLGVGLIAPDCDCFVMCIVSASTVFGLHSLVGRQRYVLCCCV
jgi:hypothetical protein